MRRIRLFTVLACASTLLGGIATTGTAAAISAPANDTVAGATNVTSLPSSFSVDTTAATSDADDAQANASNVNCQVPAVNNSVWFKFKAGNGGTLGVDTRSSNYAVGVAIATGTPGALTVVTCGLGTVATPTVLNATYYIVALDPNFDEHTNLGGTLNISFLVPPTPTVSVTVDRAGVVDRTANTVTLGGTATCANADSGSIFGQVRQAVGRYFVNAYVSTDLGPCDGQAHPWTGTTTDGTGQLRSGSATLLASDVYACNPFGCTFSSVSAVPLRLRTIRGTDPPPPLPPSGSFSLTVDPTGSVNRATNVATIGGSFICTGGGPAGFFGSMRQVVGRMFVDGGAFAEIGVCDGVAHAWSVDVLAFTGLYDEGSATIIGSAGTCDADGVVCAGTEVNARIQLHATGRRPRFGAPPVGPGAPGLVVNVDRTVPLDIGHNTAMVGGTLACAESTTHVSVYVTLRQLAGRIYIDGSASLDNSVCDGIPHKWSVAVAGQTGRFVLGTAVVLGDAYACGEIDCVDTPISLNVRLRLARANGRR